MGTHRADGRLERLTHKAVNYEGWQRKEIQLRSHLRRHQLRALAVMWGCTCLSSTIAPLSHRQVEASDWLSRVLAPVQFSASKGGLPHRV